MTTVPSNPIYLLNLPDPTKLNARFIYRYFTKDETTDETNANTLTPSDFKTNYGDPRCILLEFDPASKLAHRDTMVDGYAKYYNEIFSAQNIKRITSELMLQSNGFTKVTSEILDMQNFVNDASGGTAVSSTDAFFDGASTAANAELFQELIGNIDIPSKVYLNPSTSRPTIESADTVAKKATEAFIATEFVYDVLEASTNNPFSIYGESLSKNVETLKSVQTRQRKILSPLLIDLDEYNITVDPIEFSEDPLNQNQSGVSVIGYIILKHEVLNNGTLIPKNAIAITSVSETDFKDYNVKYGARYKYDIHPLCIIRYADDGGSVENILLIGTEAKTASISAIENVPPPPIEAIRFEWTGKKLRLRWGMPMGQINDQGGPINDIKAYQIFSRKSIDESFKLKRMLNFYDGFDSFVSAESFGNLITNYNHPITNYDFYIEPDIEYIYSMCVIDAHGNSSNLSPQYKVKLNSYKNYLEIDFISYKGAPKQYPNFMMSDKIFLDSIKVSNSSKMTVFYKPDETNIAIDGFGASEIITTNHKPPDSEGTATSPSYRLQIINVNSQSDEILDIFLPDSD